MEDTIFTRDSWKQLLAGLPCCCDGGICAKVYATKVDAFVAEVALSCDDCDNLLRVRLAPITAAWILQAGRLDENAPMQLAAPKLFLN